MLNTVKISFLQASQLSKIQEDIVVFFPSSGEVCRFDDLDWPMLSGTVPREKAIEEYGVGGMDEMYYFVWFQQLSSKGE